LLVANVNGNTVLYGTTFNGSACVLGSVFSLTLLGGSWQYHDVYDFKGAPNDGGFPIGSMAVDSSGNLYGTTYSGSLALTSEAAAVVSPLSLSYESILRDGAMRDFMQRRDLRFATGRGVALLMFQFKGKG
jgi:hypothetical protein